mmetsp:Transcript_11186/g.19696  ORF Transcript_11186/g.19696 Transcript_11186/m.19696 type:complete len:213 (-) Transcript_11186:110-748(-)
MAELGKNHSYHPGPHLLAWGSAEKPPPESCPPWDGVDLGEILAVGLAACSEGVAAAVLAVSPWAALVLVDPANQATCSASGSPAVAVVAGSSEGSFEGLQAVTCLYFVVEIQVLDLDLDLEAWQALEPFLLHSPVEEPLVQIAAAFASVADQGAPVRVVPGQHSSALAAVAAEAASGHPMDPKRPQFHACSRSSATGRATYPLLSTFSRGQP